MSQTTLAREPEVAALPPPSAVGAPHRRSGWWQKLRDRFLDLVLPPQCTFCLSELACVPEGIMLCSTCREQLATSIHRCRTCALPAPQLPTQDGRCPACRVEKPAFAAARVLGTYQDQVRQAVLKIKHVWHEPLAMTLGRLLARQIDELPLPEQPDLVVPVPMYWLRRLARGTNPAQTLAEGLAEGRSLPLANDLVRCCRWMARQSTLTISERRENVRGAYRVSSTYDIQGATILVVDDVITTAATCDEVARVLKRAGAKQVFAAAVARPGGGI